MNRIKTTYDPIFQMEMPLQRNRIYDLPEPSGSETNAREQVTHGRRNAQTACLCRVTSSLANNTISKTQTNAYE